MAYNLLARAHSSRPIDWNRLHKAVKPIRNDVQVFPIVAGAEDAVAVCLARDSVSEKNWNALQQVLLILMKRFGFLVFDLQRGVELRLDSIDEIREVLLG